MERVEIYNLPRGSGRVREWGKGPWDSEPDKITWQDPATGAYCYMSRHMDFGFWCGYVAVLPGHKYYRVDYNTLMNAFDWDAPVSELTFSGEKGFEENSVPIDILHTLHWFGFDCGHAGELAPGIRIAEVLKYDPPEIYRDQRYVENECIKLAKWLESIK
jgi:hypothetical protein